MNLRPAACILKDSQILLMKYVYEGVDVYNLPGGNYEEGETISETLIREMFEELGLIISVGELMFMAEIAQKNKSVSTLHLLFDCQIKQNEPVLNPIETSAKEVLWVNIDTLDLLNMYPNIGVQLKDKIINKTGNVFLGKINQPWF